MCSRIVNQYIRREFGDFLERGLINNKTGWMGVEGGMGTKKNKKQMPADDEKG